MCQAFILKIFKNGDIAEVCGMPYDREPAALPQGDGDPSANDLDAVAEEVKAAEAIV